MTTLYIAGPMTGLPEFNYPAFHAAAEALQVKGYATFNPADIDPGGVTRSWDWYMRRALKMMLDADGVALIEGWEISRGARIEKRLAYNLQMPTRTVADWLTLTPGAAS